MLYMTREERLLPLEKMVNTRDLGGYETQAGTYSRAHKYLRASSPSNATQKDIQDLKDYGVRVVIDLRSDFERDYNRILHSNAYKRMKHKTQVFFSPTSDHICTRLEHVSHVVSISYTIANTLGLNTELTRAIAI